MDEEENYRGSRLDADPPLTGVYADLRGPAMLVDRAQLTAGDTVSDSCRRIALDLAKPCSIGLRSGL